MDINKVTGPTTKILSTLLSVRGMYGGLPVCFSGWSMGEENACLPVLERLGHCPCHPFPLVTPSHLVSRRVVGLCPHVCVCVVAFAPVNQ